jgi:hypothetical protein
MTKETPKLTWDDKSDSYQLMNYFLMHHHFQWWGDPMQRTTYSTLKEQIHQRVCTIVDRAIEEVLRDLKEGRVDVVENRPYRQRLYNQEWQWPKA